jgi:hypothetical protein
MGDRHVGVLFGISHPGPAKGCGYCTDTLKTVGVDTIADAYRQGVQAALDEVANEASEVARIARTPSDQVAAQERDLYRSSPLSGFLAEALDDVAAWLRQRREEARDA